MPKYKIVSTTKFKRNLEALLMRGNDINLLNIVVDKLSQGANLEAKHKDHNLHGKWDGFRECHIAPDWLLIYKRDKGKLILTLMQTGTHSDSF